MKAFTKEETEAMRAFSQSKSDDPTLEAIRCRLLDLEKQFYIASDATLKLEAELAESRTSAFSASERFAEICDLVIGLQNE